MKQTMKVLCLGGAGKICSEAVRDLVEFTSANLITKITIADVNTTLGLALVAELNDARVDFRSLDLHNEDETISVMRGYDIVMDGTTIRLNDLSTRCIANAGCHGINLNGFGEEYKYSDLFMQHDRIHIPGFGMTPGTTNLMAKDACENMEKVFSVRVSHGAYRPFAFSPSIAETTSYEYDPNLPGRVVWEGGQMIQVPPFARPLEIELPDPYGNLPQYIIPHAETVTLSDYLKDKNPDLIEVRGTWPKQNMELVRTLYNWGFLRNDRIRIQGVDVGIMDCVAAYLCQSKEGTSTELYGYALHVVAEGLEQGKRVRRTLLHTHPASDGSVPSWAGLRAYTRCVGIPMAVAVKLIAEGRFQGHGVVIPERAFTPSDLFSELEKREIYIHRKVE